MCPPDDGLPSFSDDLPPVFVDRSLQLTRSPTIKGRDYWLALRGERAMPTRADISPRDMREFLSYVGLVEVAEGGHDYVMRIAGGKIEEIFGSISGQSIFKTLPRETAERWRLVFDQIRQEKTPLAVTGRVAYDNLRHLKYELFVAPLGEDETARMIFGVLDIWPVT